MYYAEKWIDGKLYWRGTPDGEWMPASIETISERLCAAEELTRKLVASHERLERDLADAKQKIADLRSISNVNGDWTMKVCQLKRENATLLALLAARDKSEC